MTRLGVNVDHVATVRQARKTTEPDPVAAAVLAELAGAHGITVHLRQDRRHIQDRDVRLLRSVVATSLNLEMANVPEMVDFARDVKPDCCTLVPERHDEVTTEGGLDVVLNESRLKGVVGELHEAGLRVSLFVDPDLEQIKASYKVGAECIELNTGRYAEAHDASATARELRKLQEMTRAARKLDLTVLAGHGLSYQNVGPVAAIPGIEELNIGHSLVSRATLVGMERAVREMKETIAQAST